MSLIQTVDLVYIYGRNTPFQTTALEHVDLQIEKGGIKAIIGHTGSGKSTLIQHFNALLTPFSGKVLVDGQDINETSEIAYRTRFKVGLCFQYPEYQLFESTVYKDIAFGPTNMGLDTARIDAAVRTAADFVGLSESLFAQSPFDLSGGQKRRVAIAGVMAMDPDVLILDEPAAGLDPAGRNRIFEMIKNYKNRTGKTIILVSHSMDDVAQVADEVVVVSGGKIAMQGTVDEVFSRSEELTQMGLAVPEVTVVTDALKKAGFRLPSGIYTVEAAANALVNCLKERGRI